MRCASDPITSIFSCSIFSDIQSLEQQSKMAPRVSDAIKEDHRELERYYDRIVQSTDQDEQTRYQNLFTWELARHSVGEELIVYPAMEKNVANGKALAEKDRREHQSVKEQLKKFQDLQASDADFIPTLKALMEDLASHIKEEEATDLPALEEALSSEESEKLSDSFGRTKMFVPSRSHPSAPSKPPYETAVGLLAAPIDHLADLFRKWPETSTMPNPSTE
ncbi:HHE domain protein [Aspergillus bombycis]|uniref:HHE domain protein n=1 Tax=Aspergillus bombycis TaxID=109264 RepID=A0A1F8A3B2_9EURO|nr:HHE domain protein [Aspergillus bombycis]OGM45909.1 HHE domain protein [Aspergillus bombycis]